MSEKSSKLWGGRFHLALSARVAAAPQPRISPGYPAPGQQCPLPAVPERLAAPSDARLPQGELPLGFCPSPETWMPRAWLLPRAVPGGRRGGAGALPEVLGAHQGGYRDHLPRLPGAAGICACWFSMRRGGCGRNKPWGRSKQRPPGSSGEG